MKILIIEDEHELSHNLAEYLRGEEYICEQAYTLSDALQKVKLYSYDCILLDLMLPDGNGLDLLGTLKQSGNSNGVIIISAKDSLDDKISGLKLGADDYLSKPFHLSELGMRIYALIRRQQFGSTNHLVCGKVSIDLLSHDVWVERNLILLTRSEYELLLFLIGNRNRVVSKSAVAEHLSGDMADLLDNQNFIYAHIKNLKAKLTAAGATDCIKNIYGTGYKWIE